MSQHINHTPEPSRGGTFWVKFDASNYTYRTTREQEQANEWASIWGPSTLTTSEALLDTYAEFAVKRKEYLTRGLSETVDAEAIAAIIAGVDKTLQDDFAKLPTADEVASATRNKIIRSE